MRYRKRPIEIEATQWFQNGDHPKDDSWPAPIDGETVLCEGKIVRRYRRPGDPGDRICEKCSRFMDVHGWIDTLEGGHVVCPGDWIITGIKGENYPCKPDIFADTYEDVK